MSAVPVLNEPVQCQIVDPSAIDAIWPFVRDGVARALESSEGEATPEDTRKGLVAGRTRLMLMQDGEANLGVVFMILDFPRMRIARVLLAFGNRMAWLRDAMEVGEQWAKSQGCSAVEGWVATESRARLFSRWGYTPSYTIIRKRLA